MIHITTTITIGHITGTIIQITVIITIVDHIIGIIIQITATTTTGHIVVTIDIMEIIILITAIITIMGIMVTVVGRVFPAWAQNQPAPKYSAKVPP